jgi:hypothetical protein
MPATYEPIATTTLGANTTTISFTSIPSTYTDLRVIYTFIRGANAGSEVFLRFNTDTATNYSDISLYGDGTSAASYRNTSATKILVNDSQGSATPSLGTIDVFSYAGSTNKTVLSTLSSDRNGSGWAQRGVGLWRSTAAITSVQLTCGQTNGWGVGSTATLYGIKNA